MKLKTLSTVMALAMSMPSYFVNAADTTFSADQQKEVQKIVHDYLVSNPEVLIEVSQALQQKQQQNMQQQAKDAILNNSKALFDTSIGVEGNKKGNVTLVEFFDYQCIHCKKMAPVLSDLVKKDNNLRIIYKEFPIFGQSSELASRVALAASMQGKYMQFHNALFKVEKHLDENSIMNVAKSVGLNMTKLKKDMDSDKVKESLTANRDLAEKLHLMGTPAFIVAATPDGEFKATPEPAFVPGAASIEALQDLINKAAGKTA